MYDRSDTSLSANSVSGLYFGNHGVCYIALPAGDDDSCNVTEVNGRQGKIPTDHEAASAVPGSVRCTQTFDSQRQRNGTTSQRSLDFQSGLSSRASRCSDEGSEFRAASSLKLHRTLTVPLVHKHQITTLMLLRLPPQWTNMTLCEALDELGFPGLYDFLHLPWNSKSHGGRVTFETKGYAFVNMISVTAAASLVALLRENGAPWQGDDQCAVAVAATQGYMALVKEMRKQKLDRIRNPCFRPFVAPERGHSEQ